MPDDEKPPPTTPDQERRQRLWTSVEARCLDLLRQRFGDGLEAHLAGAVAYLNDASRQRQASAAVHLLAALQEARTVAAEFPQSDLARLSRAFPDKATEESLAALAQSTQRRGPRLGERALLLASRFALLPPTLSDDETAALTLLVLARLGKRPGCLNQRTTDTVEKVFTAERSNNKKTREAKDTARAIKRETERLQREHERAKRPEQAAKGGGGTSSVGALRAAMDAVRPPPSIETIYRDRLLANARPVASRLLEDQQRLNDLVNPPALREINRVQDLLNPPVFRMFDRLDRLLGRRK